MSKKEEAILRSLLLGGVLGASLGALILKNNRGESTVLGAIAATALLASVKANERAKKTEIPLVIEEDHALYRIYADGSRKFLKNLPKPEGSLPKKFTLK